jgi:serine/threonine protein kinase
VVYLGQDVENPKKKYAIKCIPKHKITQSALMTRLFKAEVHVMSIIDHPHVMHLYEFIESQNNFYLVIRFCNDGDLAEKIKDVTRLQEAEAILLLKQIMLGFFELHKHKIMHRDFKLANIFLHEGEAVIGDFGFAKSGAEMASTRLGTPYNMAPEILLSKGNTQYTNKTDLWSIGVVYY